MKLIDIFSDIYFDKKAIRRSDYERGRKLFTYEGCAAMGIFSITSGAFLAGLAEHMGASDEFNGIIGAIPALAGVVQIFSSLVFEKLEKRKFLICIMCFCFRFLLGLMFLIPFIIQNPNYRLAALAGFYGVAYVLAAFITPPAANWIVNLTPENIRGRYFAIKDSYSLAFVTITTLLMGRILDRFKNNNSINEGYAIIGAVVIILTIINFIFISSIKEPLTQKIIGDFKFKDVILNPIKNRSFRKIIVLFILWNVGLQIAGPFFSVYMVTKLRLTYTYIMIMGVITSLVRVILVVYWGRFADSRSWISSAKYSIAVLAICHGLWTIVDKNTMMVMIPLLHIIGGIAWAGINISLFNIQFVFAPKEGRTMYLGLNAAIGGSLGFLSTVLGSVLLKFLGNFKLDLFIISIGSIQVLFALSGIIFLICAIYIHLFIKEIKRG